MTTRCPCSFSKAVKASKCDQTLIFPWCKPVAVGAIKTKPFLCKLCVLILALALCKWLGVRFSVTLSGSLSVLVFGRHQALSAATAKANHC